MDVYHKLSSAYNELSINIELFKRNHARNFGSVAFYYIQLQDIFWFHLDASLNQLKLLGYWYQTPLELVIFLW